MNSQDSINTFSTDSDCKAENFGERTRKRNWVWFSILIKSFSKFDCSANSAELKIVEKEPEKEMGFTPLPEELIGSNILSRLPVKTLLRFKCLSKQWCTLISSPWFISEHRKKLSSNPDDHHILVTTFRGTSGLISIRSPSYVVKLSQPYKYGHSVVGSINGLVCLRISIRLVYLWNPLMNQFLTISPPLLYVKKIRVDVGMGFGYEPNSDDYKFIYIQSYSEGSQVTEKVDVYSTKLESWSQVHNNIYLGVTYRICDAIVEGFTYWVIQNTDEPHKASIASFGLTSETFNITPVPDVLITKSQSFIAMNYRGSFALLAYISDCLEVWMIEGDGLWQKKFIFDMGIRISRHWGLNNGEIVVQNYPNRPFMFDPRTNEMKILGTESTASAFYYTGSLVSIKGFKSLPGQPMRKGPLQRRKKAKWSSLAHLLN